MTVAAPASVSVVGSYAWRAALRPEATLDVALELPAGLLAPKAHLNHRYHARRALYLLAVARHLRDASYSLFGQQTLQVRGTLLAQPVGQHPSKGLTLFI